nr:MULTISPECIES: aminotransferase class III-fold pyridoxal phosphate-dependent enzyme [unclassified Bradyrhizobium]
MAKRSIQFWREAADRIGAFSHGNTYSGHPIAAAAASAELDIVEKERLSERARLMGSYFQRRLKERFAQWKLSGSARARLLAANQFVADRHTRRRFDPQLKVGGARISKAARDRGSLRERCRTGIFGFAPPLIVSEAEIDEIVELGYRATKQVMDELAKEIGRD